MLKTTTQKLLEYKSKKVLDLIPKTWRFKYGVQRPLFIEIAGTPRSGKSELISGIERFLTHNGYLVKVVDERIPEFNFVNKLHPIYALEILYYKLSKLTQLIDSEYQIILIDRGLFDSLVWLKWHFDNYRISDEEFNYIKSLIANNLNKTFMDLVLVLESNPRLSLKRELSLKFVKTPGSIVNQEILSSLNKSMDTTYDEYKSKINIKKLPKINYPEKLNTTVLTNILDLVKIHNEDQILAIPKKDLSKLGIVDGYYEDPKILLEFNKLFEKNAKAHPRLAIENNKNYVQVVPITFIKYKDTILIMHRFNLEKSDDSMHKSHAAWVGGHIKVSDGPINTIYNCVRRKLAEEVYLRSDKNQTLEFNGILYTPKTMKRSPFHLALVHTLHIHDKKIYDALNLHKFKEATWKHYSCEFVKSANLLKNHPEIDPWTKAIYQNLV